MHDLRRKLLSLGNHFFERLKTANFSTACGTSTLKSLPSRAFFVSDVHLRPRKHFSRCTLDCGFKTSESPALRGFVGGPRALATAALYLVIFLKNHIKPQIGSIPLADLTSLDLQRFYKHLLDGGRVDRIEAKKKPKGLAPKTVRNIHQMIGSAYNLAMEQKLVTRNPTQGCALPKVEHKEMKTLTADQLSAFFQEARDSGVYELYYLDLATGLRRGELLGLKWADVDLDRGVLKIQRAISRQNGKVVETPLKTKNAYRTLPLSADAIDVLMQQRRKTGNSEWVFPSPSGGPMSPDSVLHMLQRVLKRAGLPRIRFHDLRHTFATMALQNGVDVKTVSSMLGHYSAGFTLDIYAHVTTDAQLKAAQTMGNILSRAV